VAEPAPLLQPKREAGRIAKFEIATGESELIDANASIAFAASD